MSPIVKDSQVLAASPESLTATPAPRSLDTAARPQAVALEVAVTVNGARSIDGSDKRETFSESTKTVLVHGNGAVIRVSSALAPGQLLFLTNQKTKKEVVCQVIKSKSYRSVSGYVELEFTEPIVGFWGMRFPTDRIGSQPAVPALPQQVPTSSALPPNSHPHQDAPVASNASEVGVVAPKAPLPSSSALPSVPTSAGNSNDGSAHTDTATKVVEFVPKHSAPASTNHGPAVLASIPTVVTHAKAEPVKIDAPSAKSLLDSEEVKIPAWLEPLARNAATRTPLEEPAREGEQQSKDLQPAEEIDDSDFVESAEKHPEEEHSPSAVRGVFEVARPSFEDRLLLGEDSAASARPNKGLLIGAIAAGLLVFAGAGGWYAYHSSNTADASSTKPSNAAPPSSGAGNVARAVSQPSIPLTNTSSAPVSTPTTSNTAYAKPPAAGITPPVNANSTPPVSASESPVAEDAQPKKPALGKVRLAAPRVQRSAAGRDNAEPELSFAGSESLVASADPLGSGLGGATAKQPVAPSATLTVGGNVKQAKLLSTAQPVYPSLAKSQRISGDVKINAIIDTNGRVSVMKVISGPTMLHQAAQDALGQWKYQPAMLDGKAVQMQLTVTLQFRLP